ELRKVAWPDRTEVVNYSILVFIVLVILIGIIFVLDWGFGKFVFFLFKK
ncbi:MAG: SecE/Sec61-gamma subunit of protein translocation complex, partial [Acidimicrobiales bacterium]|nr:SecE/Sec61-gamma subunit of protein translocation complex [Acidimicrobiales bacterium]